jgi:hypothetical protein
MEVPVQAVRLVCRQIRTLLGWAVMGSENYSSEGHVLRLSRKASSQAKVPVPQTDTGRRAEHAKARGRTLVKELGKMTP